METPKNSKIFELVANSALFVNGTTIKKKEQVQIKVYLILSFAFFIINSSALFLSFFFFYFCISLYSFFCDGF